MVQDKVYSSYAAKVADTKPKVNRDRLIKFFGSGDGTGANTSIEQDTYGNFILVSRPDGEQTYTMYFYVDPNGYDWSLNTGAEIVKKYKKAAAIGGGIEALRKKLYEVKIISKAEYLSQDEAALNNGILAAANNHSLEQVQKYTLNPGQNDYKFTPFTNWLKGKKSGLEPEVPELPQRQVQPLERASINDFVDSIYLTTKGQLASNEEKKKWFKEFEKLNTGTLTTTKKVKNPTTGVLENVSTTTRGFNQDTAQAKIEADIKKNNPLEYQRRKAFEFSSEFNKIMSGGM